MNSNLPYVWKIALYGSSETYIKIINMAYQMGFLDLIKISWIKKGSLLQKYKINIYNNMSKDILKDISNDILNDELIDRSNNELIDITNYD